MKVRIETEASDDKFVAACGTRFFLEDGEELTDITKCVVTYAIDDIVRAEFSVLVSPETIEAHPILSLKSLKEAAAFYGLDLVEFDSKRSTTKS